jgi:hypothetical protein
LQPPPNAYNYSYAARRAHADARPGLSETGKQKTGRMKFRLSGTGKFVHRNRFRRRNVVCCLHGTSHWLFVESSSGISDSYLNATTNDNWNGFRSNAYPTTLSLEQMHTIAADMVSQGVRAHVQRFTAGDVLTFDGRWWHATNYTAPVLNMCARPSHAAPSVDETFQVFDFWQRRRGDSVYALILSFCSRVAGAAHCISF